MADNYEIKAVTTQSYKFKVLERSSVYSYYMFPSLESISYVKDAIVAGKIITCDKLVASTILKGSNRGTTVYFYHFEAGQGGLNGGFWLPKYDIDGRQLLTTDMNKVVNDKLNNSNIQNSISGTSELVTSETKDNYISDKLQSNTDAPILNSSGSFDFSKWTSRLGEYNEEWLHNLRSKMVIYDDRNKWQDSYNLMQFQNPHTVQNGTREYIFFTKCDLNIMKDANTLNPVLANNAFWLEMQRKYRDQISVLQKGNARRSGFLVDEQPFIPMLTNMVRSRMDLPGISMDTMDTPKTIYGTSWEYAGSSFKSDEGIDFSLEMADTPELELYHIFKMYSMYENMKSIGMISPPGPDNLNPYRVNRILHDQFAMYKFVVSGDDMESILFYAKAYGVIFKNVPRDGFNNIDVGEITYSIDFHAQVIRDLDPIILYEFNKKAQEYFGGTPDPNNYIPIYNTKFQEINAEFRPCPYIVEVANGKKTQSKYRLQFFKR